MITEGSNVQGAAMSGPHSVNGTYDQVVFTARAVEHIYATAAKNANIERRRNMQRNFAPNHGRNNSVTAKETAEAVTVADEVEVEMEEQQQPLFVALMYHNVHDACMKDRKTTSGLNAPFETVNLYSTTKLDTWKVMGAMVTELDYGMGNLTDALESTGMWANSVIIFVSDNGGPLSHSTNHPLRGGKGSQWEGGVRVEAFVNSPLIPAARRGTTYNGMVHSSDWYVTIAAGIAGGILPGDTGSVTLMTHPLSCLVNSLRTLMGCADPPC